MPDRAWSAPSHAVAWAAHTGAHQALDCYVQAVTVTTGPCRHAGILSYTQEPTEVEDRSLATQ